MHAMRGEGGSYIFQQELCGHEGLVDGEDGQVVIAAPARPREHLHPVALLHHQPCAACIAERRPVHQNALQLTCAAPVMADFMACQRPEHTCRKLLIVRACCPSYSTCWTQSAPLYARDHLVLGNLSIIMHEAACSPKQSQWKCGDRWRQHGRLTGGAEGLRSNGHLDLRLKANGGLGAGGEEAAHDELVQAALVGVPALVGVGGGPSSWVDRRVGVVIVASPPRHRPHLPAVYALRMLPPACVVHMLPHQRLVWHSKFCISKGSIKRNEERTSLVLPLVLVTFSWACMKVCVPTCSHACMGFW